MPKGSGCRQRQGERFRLRKNDEFMAEQRAKTFKLLGLEIDYIGRTEQEVIDLGDAMIKAALRGDDVATSMLACDAYICDKPLVDAVKLETKSTEKVSPVKVVTHEIHEVDDGEFCDQKTSIVSGGDFIPLTHKEHPSHRVNYSGDIVESCFDFCQDKCQIFDVCDTSDGLTGKLQNHPYPCSHIGLTPCRRDRFVKVSDVSVVVKDDCVLPTAAESDPHISERIKNAKLGKRKVCKCVYACEHSKTYHKSVKKCRSLVRSFNLKVYHSATGAIPVEIIQQIESHLSCREKFLLVLNDGQPRKGCSLQHRGISRGCGKPSDSLSIGCNKTLHRCICQSAIYRYGCPPNILNAIHRTGIGVMNHPDPPAHVHYTVHT